MPCRSCPIMPSRPCLPSSKAWPLTLAVLMLQISSINRPSTAFNRTMPKSGSWAARVESPAVARPQTAMNFGQNQHNAAKSSSWRSVSRTDYDYPASRSQLWSPPRLNLPLMARPMSAPTGEHLRGNDRFVRYPGEPLHASPTGFRLN